jgi:hypothetical protein
MALVRVKHLRMALAGAAVVAGAATGATCSLVGADDPSERVQEAVSTVPQSVPPPGPLQHGKDPWLKATLGGATFGGEDDLGCQLGALVFVTACADCRSLTTNWMGGPIWEAFSSDEKKARGPGYYRDVPLLGTRATAPFFHDNRLGTFSGDPNVAGRLAPFDDPYRQMVHPWLCDELGSIQRTTAPVTLSVAGFTITLPTGTPVALFANLDPSTLQLRCADLVENGGHYSGALLPTRQQDDLKGFLETL